MRHYVLKRLIAFPVVLLVIYAAAVGLLMAAPGDPLQTGERPLSPEVLAEKRIAYNYDQPWWRRYFWTWPKRLVWDGDLPAHQYEDWTVVEILRSALPVSLQLGLVALNLALLGGLLAGAASVAMRGTPLEAAAVGLALVGVSAPTFVVGAILLMVAGLGLGWGAVGGWGRAEHVVLPAITLALPYAAYIAQLTRAELLKAYQQDFVRAARARGIGPWRVLFEHALRNAVLPVLSYLGPAAAAIFTGSFVVEQVFRVPGMGTHVVESIHNRDQTLILATVLVYAVLLAGFNLLVDVLYAVVDPRVRVGRSVA